MKQKWMKKAVHESVPMDLDDRTEPSGAQGVGGSSDVDIERSLRLGALRAAVLLQHLQHNLQMQDKGPFPSIVKTSPWFTKHGSALPSQGNIPSGGHRREAPQRAASVGQEASPRFTE